MAAAAGNKKNSATAESPARLIDAKIGLIIVWAAIVALVWLTSKIFRVGILMYGKRPTLPEIAKWVRYK